MTARDTGDFFLIHRSTACVTLLMKQDGASLCMTSLVCYDQDSSRVFGQYAIGCGLSELS